MEKTLVKLLIEHSGVICHNCKTEFKSITTKDGGLLGHCVACDTLKWVIPPSLAQHFKLPIKFSPDERYIDRKEVIKMLKGLK